MKKKVKYAWIMKANHHITCLLILLTTLFHTRAAAQNIRGDTIYVDANSVAVVVFPAPPSKADLAINDGQEGWYEVNDMGRKSLSIKALKKDAKHQALEVTEGGRKHLFILSYREGSPARNIDLSTKKKIAARVEERKKDIAKALSLANNLFDQAKSNVSNQQMWQEVEAQYLQLQNVADSRDAELVKSRLEESRNHVQQIKEKKYSGAIQDALNHYSVKKYSEARKAYLLALEHKPGDIQATKYVGLTDSVWAKEFVDKGDEAYKSKKYVQAKANYQEAMSIKPDYPSLQNKYNQVKKDADPLIYKNEKAKGDQALKVNDIEEARRAYDSALSVRQGDPEVMKRLEKVVIEEQIIEQEEKKVAAYEGVLAAAKNLADKAADAQEFDLAIKEFERALDIIPTRKFPKRKMDELTKRKKALKAN